MMIRKKHRSILKITIITACFLLIYIFNDFIYALIPWTRWETMRTIKYGGDVNEIMLSIGYLGNDTEHPEYPEYIKYIIQHIDDCRKGLYGMERGSFYAFPGEVAYAADSALTKLTGLDFGYEWLDDCEGPQNQAAIQAWKDWYENDYDEWLVERHNELVDD